MLKNIRAIFLYQQWENNYRKEGLADFKNSLILSIMLINKRAHKSGIGFYCRYRFFVFLQLAEKYFLKLKRL